MATMTKPVPVTNPANMVSGTRGQRETVPINFNPYYLGFYGLIPRRGVQDPYLFSKLWTNPEQHTYLMQQTSLRLLSYLPEIDPLLGLAVWNALRLSCNGDDFRIVATKSAAAGAQTADTDDAATSEVDALWKQLPGEIGGIDGLRISMTLMGLFTGLVSAEAVPGAILEGIYRVWPVDSMTLVFGRDDVNADVTAYQYQYYTGRNNPFGYARLDEDRFFWRALDNWVDDPYGRAPYANAFTEIMADISLIKDIRDAMHHVAWPRIQIGFNFAETYKIATEIVGIRDPQAASAWVQERFQEVVEYVKKIKSDDAIVHDINGTSDIIEGGKGLGNLPEILAFLRQRVVQACKTLPTLVGINDGSTQTYTSVEWAIYAAGLETVRAMVASVLVNIADLHLRLKGIPLTCHAVYRPIRTNDEFVDAQSEQLKIANAVRKVLLGWMSNEDACRHVTGNAPVGDQAEEAILSALAGAPSPNPDPEQAPQGDDPEGDDQSPPKGQKTKAKQKGKAGQEDG